jgi:hypothetical protein
VGQVGGVTSKQDGYFLLGLEGILQHLLASTYSFPHSQYTHTQLRENQSNNLLSLTASQYPMADKPTAPNPPVVKDERRRSSGAFANLMALKRDPNNTSAESRRKSVTEMKMGKPGVIGKLWHE